LGDRLTREEGDPSNGATTAGRNEISLAKPLGETERTEDDDDEYEDENKKKNTPKPPL
jgi:hypothetical protein